MREHSINQEYALVLEYADNDTLNTYLRRNFDRLGWNDKYQFALQLASAVACIHECDIIHRDLHARNIFVHQNKLKLADFGLSTISIINGRREEVIEGTPAGYSKLYTECWKFEPDERPNMREVVSILKALISPEQNDTRFDDVYREEIISLESSESSVGIDINRSLSVSSADFTASNSESNSSL
ncbi:unnamed protein product [Rhizophagus irregularis]|nr:unnamed protein product [Rhizophagus irregularis]